MPNCQQYIQWFAYLWKFSKNLLLKSRESLLYCSVVYRYTEKVRKLKLRSSRFSKYFDSCDSWGNLPSQTTFNNYNTKTIEIEVIDFLPLVLWHNTRMSDGANWFLLVYHVHQVYWWILLHLNFFTVLTPDAPLQEIVLQIQYRYQYRWFC